MNYKSFGDLSEDISSNINKVQGKGYDLVVGIPRSGMIPAYMISLLLNVDCIDLNSFLENVPISRGSSRRVASSLERAKDAKKILLVDDSASSGASFASALEKIPPAFLPGLTRLAIYVDPVSKANVDVFFELLLLPRVFQWNIFHHPIIAESCVGLEGVLCVEPTNEQIASETAYLNYTERVHPLYLPTYKIHTLITRRPERYRNRTIAWLERHRVEYGHLIMLESRGAESALGKAQYYNKLDLSFYIESDPGEAERITRLSGKPVFSVVANKLFEPGVLSVVKYGKQHMVNRLQFKTRRLASSLFKPVVRRLFTRRFGN